MEITLRSSEIPTAPGETEVSGAVYSFVPAHGESDAGVVVRKLCRSISEERSVLLADFCSKGYPVWGTPEAPQRLDRESWGVFLSPGTPPGTPFDTLATREAHPREIPRLLDHARAKYGVTCANLTGATQVAALEMLRHSDWIFLVAASDALSLERARYKAEWLRSLNLAGNSGLLMHCVAGGAGVSEAEELTGLPVCALLDHAEELDRLAVWLAAPRG
jgi:hypothetical protein